MKLETTYQTGDENEECGSCHCSRKFLKLSARTAETHDLKCQYVEINTSFGYRPLAESDWLHAVRKIRLCEEMAEIWKFWSGSAMACYAQLDEGNNAGKAGSEGPQLGHN